VTSERSRAGDQETSDSRFARLLDSGIIGIFEGDETGRIVEGNGAFLQMLGYSREDLEQGLIRWDRVTVPGCQRVNRRFHEQLKAFGHAEPAEKEYYRKDGSHIPVLVGLAALKPVRGESGRGEPGREENAPRARAIGFMLDLTERRRIEDALKSSEEKFRQLAENIHEVFWIMDVAAGEILYVSPAYEQIWGQKRECLYADPENWIRTIHPEDRRQALEVFSRQVCGEAVENEYRIVQPSGDVRWIRDRAFPVRDGDGRMIRLAGIAEDATERKLSELRVVHQSLHDELTGIPNRRFFREKLTQAIAEREEGRTGAVLFLDLDQFKLVNDSLGHLEGDRLLQGVVQRMLAVCAEGTLARFGGDEFTLLATGFDGPEPVRRLGERLIRCLDEPFRIADRDVYVGASIGISLFPEHGTDPYAEP